MWTFVEYDYFLKWSIILCTYPRVKPFDEKITKIRGPIKVAVEKACLEFWWCLHLNFFLNIKCTPIHELDKKNVTSQWKNKKTHKTKWKTKKSIWKLKFLSKIVRGKLLIILPTLMSIFFMLVFYIHLNFFLMFLLKVGDISKIKPKFHYKIILNYLFWNYHL
jgi:hypothetical protein